MQRRLLKLKEAHQYTFAAMEGRIGIPIRSIFIPRLDK